MYIIAITTAAIGLVTVVIFLGIVVRYVFSCVFRMGSGAMNAEKKKEWVRRRVGKNRSETDDRLQESNT